MSLAPETFDKWYIKSSYQQFVKQEGVPLYEGSALEDLASVPLGAVRTSNPRLVRRWAMALRNRVSSSTIKSLITCSMSISLLRGTAPLWRRDYYRSCQQSCLLR